MCSTGLTLTLLSAPRTRLPTYATSTETSGRRRSSATFHECVLPRFTDSGTAVWMLRVFGSGRRPVLKSGSASCGIP